MVLPLTKSFTWLRTEDVEHDLLLKMFQISLEEGKIKQTGKSKQEEEERDDDDDDGNDGGGGDDEAIWKP